MSATSALTLEPTGRTATRHQAPGTAARTGHAGRHRLTGRGRLACPIVLAPLAAPAIRPVSGGRPAPLARPGRPAFALGLAHQRAAT